MISLSEGSKDREGSGPFKNFSIRSLCFGEDRGYVWEWNSIKKILKIFPQAIGSFAQGIAMDFSLLALQPTHFLFSKVHYNSKRIGLMKMYSWFFHENLIRNS